MSRSISIIIPTHQRAELLGRALMSLRELEIPAGAEVELIVAANACTDQTHQVVSECAVGLHFPVRCVIEPVPGAALARNTAMRHSNSDYFIFLDDDIWIYPDCLVGILSAFDQTNADIVLGKVELWWEAVARPEWFDAYHASLLSEVDLAEETIETKEFKGASANMAIKRTVAERIGLFRVNLDRIGNRILSAGETDLMDRTMRAGGKVVYTPLARVKHWVAPHRISLNYLRRVAYGNTYSQMLCRDKPQPIEIVRIIVIKTYRWTTRSLRALAATAVENPNAHRKYRLGAASAAGSIAGLIRRLRTGPLANPQLLPCQYKQRQSMRSSFSGNRVHSDQWRMQDTFFKFKRFLPGSYRIRRARVYCVGMGKTGTHSICGMFSDEVRAVHEPEALQLIDKILDWHEGRITERQFTDFLLQRDRATAYEVDSSALNFQLIDILLREFPDGKFVLTIRDCYTWLNSVTNEHLRSNHPQWRRMRDHRFGKSGFVHGPGEEILQDRGLFPLESYLALWSKHNHEVLAKIPSERLLVVRTNQIMKCAYEIADFCGLPRRSVRLERTHEYQNTTKLLSVRDIDRVYLERLVEKHCRPLMSRFFPEIKSLDDTVE